MARVDISIHADLLVLSSPHRRCISRRPHPTGAFSRFVDRVLSLNFNITGNAIWYAGREIYFAHDTPPRAALRGRVTLDLRTIEFVRMFFRDLNAICAIKTSSPLFIRSHRSRNKTNTEIE